MFSFLHLNLECWTDSMRIDDIIRRTKIYANSIYTLHLYVIYCKNIILINICRMFCFCSGSIMQSFAIIILLYSVKRKTTH